MNVDQIYKDIEEVRKKIEAFPQYNLYVVKGPWPFDCLKTKTKSGFDFILNKKTFKELRKSRAYPNEPYPSLGSYAGLPVNYISKRKAAAMCNEAYSEIVTSRILQTVIV